MPLGGLSGGAKDGYDNDKDDDDDDDGNDDNEENIIREATESILSEFTFATIEESDAILYYDEGRYVKGGEVLIKKLCEDFHGFNLNISKRAEIREHIKNRTYRKLSEFDKDVNIINMKNGLYNIEANELLPHTPDYLSMNQIPVVYDRDAATPKEFAKFLSEVVYPAEIRTLVESMAYTFHRDNPFEIITILLGNGSNGKSVEFGILAALHGQTNVSNVSCKSIIENPFALHDLVGKNCNLDAELSSARIEDTAILKKVTGRQMIRVEQKNQKAHDVRIYAKMWLCANNIPYTSDQTDAWYKRNCIITFPNTFDVQENLEKGIRKLDPYLIDKLTTEQELSGIFNVLMKALRTVLKNKEIFQNEKTIEDRKRKYLSVVDPVQGFRDTAIDEASTESSRTTKEATYLAFVEYCRMHRLNIRSKDSFSKSMKKHGLEDGKDYFDGKQYRVWQGIRLTSQYNKLVEDVLAKARRQQSTID